MRKENLVTYHNLNYSINYYSLTKKGGPDPWTPPGSAPGYGRTIESLKKYIKGDSCRNYHVRA